MSGTPFSNVNKHTVNEQKAIFSSDTAENNKFMFGVTRMTHNHNLHLTESIYYKSIKNKTKTWKLWCFVIKNICKTNILPTDQIIWGGVTRNKQNFSGLIQKTKIIYRKRWGGA